MSEEVKQEKEIAMRSFVVELSDDGQTFNVNSTGSVEMSDEEIYSTIEALGEGIKEHREAKKFEAAAFKALQKYAMYAAQAQQNAQAANQNTEENK